MPSLSSTPTNPPTHLLTLCAPALLFLLFVSPTYIDAALQALFPVVMRNSLDDFYALWRPQQLQHLQQQAHDHDGSGTATAAGGGGGACLRDGARAEGGGSTGTSATAALVAEEGKEEEEDGIWCLTRLASR